MNERIEHITKQVDEYFDDLSIEFSRQAWMEKFAELIIEECCNVLQGEDIRYGGYGYNQGFLHKKIKEHFLQKG